MHTLNARTIAITVFFFLITILVIGGCSFVYLRWRDAKSSPPTSQATQKTLTLPVPLEHPRVSSAFLHYFFHGKIKEIQKTADDSRIILEDTDSALPAFVITPTTRISLIAPPYNASTVSPLSLSKLHAGAEIELSMEYDLRSTTWRVQDVFVPTDRNPELSR